MREFACDFGTKTKLVGIYTQSDEKKPSQQNRPALLLINSGLLPNTGPFRLYVRLARQLAESGFDCFRFDLSGIGDSERSTDTMARDQQQIRDIRLAMDYVQETFGNDSFVAMGICTGADNAHRAMLADHRVVGAIGVDGYYYKTSRYYLNYFFKQLIPRLLKRSNWEQKFSTISASLYNSINSQNDENESPASIQYRWEVPSREKTASDYRSFIERDVSKLCIFTASWPYNYLNQHADSFPSIEFGNNVQIRYLENTEHLFPLEEERQQLTQTISKWLFERFDSASESNTQNGFNETNEVAKKVVNS